MKEELIKKIEKIKCAELLGPTATDLVKELVDEIEFLEKRMSIDELELNSNLTKDYTYLKEFIMRLAKEADLDIERLREQIEVRGEHIALLKEKVKGLELALEQVTSITYWVPEANKEYSIEEQEIDRLGHLLKRKDEYIKKLEQEVRDYAFDANNNFAICNNINAIKENERLEKLLQEKDEYIKGLQYERDKVRSIIYACTSEINENVISKLEKAYDF